MTRWSRRTPTVLISVGSSGWPRVRYPRTRNVSGVLSAGRGLSTPQLLRQAKQPLRSGSQGASELVFPATARSQLSSIGSKNPPHDRTNRRGCVHLCRGLGCHRDQWLLPKCNTSACPPHSCRRRRRRPSPCLEPRPGPATCCLQLSPAAERPPDEAAVGRTTRDALRQSLRCPSRQFWDRPRPSPVPAGFPPASGRE